MQKIFAMLIFVTIFFTGCLDSNEQGSRNDDASVHHQKLIVGLDDAYAPFGFRNEDNELVGFDIDLANEVAERMGVTMEFKPIDWNTKEKELTSGDIDIIWSGFNVTPDRNEYVLYSKPYMENRQVILVRKGNTEHIITASDLAGKSVGTQLGAPSDEYLNREENLKKSFGKYLTYDNYKNVFTALKDGKIDAVICDELVVRYEINKNHDAFEIVEDTVGDSTEIGIGFRKTDTELRDRVQEVFDDMVRDGTARKISVHWFNADLILTHHR